MAVNVNVSVKKFCPFLIKNNMAVIADCSKIIDIL